MLWSRVEVLDPELAPDAFLPEVDGLPDDFVESDFFEADFVEADFAEPAVLPDAELFGSSELLFEVEAFLPAALAAAVVLAAVVLVPDDAEEVVLAELFAAVLVALLAVAFSEFAVDFIFDGASFVLLFVVAMVLFV